VAKCPLNYTRNLTSVHLKRANQGVLDTGSMLTDVRYQGELKASQALVSAENLYFSMCFSISAATVGVHFQYVVANFDSYSRRRHDTNDIGKLHYLLSVRFDFCLLNPHPHAPLDLCGRPLSGGLGLAAPGSLSWWAFACFASACCHLRPIAALENKSSTYPCDVVVVDAASNRRFLGIVAPLRGAYGLPAPRR